ncbi:MAG: hypothetical protein P1U32_03330 [Legionellaceae bacterium]|nr:hypothetical protein [Legionellaceae bacterium]
MSEQPTDNHQEKLKQFKKAIENNEFSINSSCIAEALLEAQKLAKQSRQSLKEPELA